MKLLKASTCSTSAITWQMRQPAVKQLFQNLPQKPVMQIQTIPPSQTLGNIDMLEARNDILDVFADLEARVCELLSLAKATIKPVHFGAKVEAFKSLEGIERINTVHFPSRAKLADEITALLPVRADIVHSRMRVCMMDGTPTGKFVNSQNQGEPYPRCRLLDINELRKLRSEVQRIINDLGNLARKPNPASSPPPPSPGAAGDP